jgi:hypothetical protein
LPAPAAGLGGARERRHQSSANVSAAGPDEGISRGAKPGVAEAESGQILAADDQQEAEVMTEGFALGFGWLIFCALLAVLVAALMRPPR